MLPARLKPDLRSGFIAIFAHFTLDCVANLNVVALVEPLARHKPVMRDILQRFGTTAAINKAEKGKRFAFAAPFVQIAANVCDIDGCFVIDERLGSLWHDKGHKHAVRLAGFHINAVASLFVEKSPKILLLCNLIHIF
jgi:hypothetical protein